MYQQHPELQQPNLDQVIWHYFSLAKFLGLLDKSALYFCRHDKFDDSFEGMLSEKDKQIFDSLQPGMSKNVVGDGSGCYYSNCWTKSKIDEYVLWKTYASLKDGVAVKTTVERLINSLDVSDKRLVYISYVLYIDYQNEYTFQKMGGVVNILAPHFTKREYFRSEKELRLMYVDWSGKFGTSPDGIEFKVDLRTLVEEVYVAPFSYDWLHDVLTHILKQFGLDGVKVLKSSI